MALFRRFFHRKSPDGLLEISERIYVFDCCFSTDVVEEDEYKVYTGGIVTQLEDYFPDASFMVFNFREGEKQSQISDILSNYDMTVMDYPRQYEGCPLLSLEMTHHFLRSSEAWLSLEGHQNVLLMHCERGGWPVLTFVLAGLLLFRKHYHGEQEALKMICRLAPKELLYLSSPLNSQPSQLRYLQYISRRNLVSDWPPSDTPLLLDCLILRHLPLFDGKGCRPVVRLYGQDASTPANRSSKLLFSSSDMKKHALLYIKAESVVKINIQCHVQGDVVLECIHLDEDLVQEEMMLRIVFHTAFVQSNKLVLKRDEVDALWEAKDQFPKHFKAEVLFVDADDVVPNPTSDMTAEAGNEAESALPEHFFVVEEKFSNAIDAQEGKGESNASTLPGKPDDGDVEERGKDDMDAHSFQDCASVDGNLRHNVKADSGYDALKGVVVVDVKYKIHQGENTHSLRWEGIAAVTETNMEVTSVGDSASSLAINNGSVEDTAAGVSNLVQIPDLTLPKQEKVYQQDYLPSLTSMSSGHDYDVFLSFRGPDTRSGITNVLYTRLLGAGIRTFKDDEELRIGEEFGPELLEAASQSKIAIPIFSKGYASSKWCLNELVQMVECSKTRRQKIMPIFFNVTPAEVRHQIGSYEEAFLLHKEKFGANISKWKAALNHVANLNGWDNSKKNRGEGELVDEIVKKVIDELKTTYLLVTDCLVGVENHVKEIDTMMCVDLEDIRILGIHGMGGVGKTTLAKIIYNRLLHHFEACCFLSDIRETSELKGIEVLQNQLISDVLKRKWSNISNVEEGIRIIKERLCGKKVLLLLDDVDQMTHWDALIGRPAWFGIGSRIVITSRNRDVVDVPEVRYPYELMSLNFNQSLQLFCKHAFGRDYPLDDHVAFSTEVVESTGGLPLALEAIGKLLLRRSKDVWDVILKKLKQVPLNEVKRKLKISYDSLDDCQKHIFLEIACLFTGFDQRIVLHSWRDSNLFPEEGLEVLQKFSLIKISEDNKLWMHDQLRGLGRDIVRQECDKERKKKTQLGNHWDPLDVVMETKGTKKIEALCRKFDAQLLCNFPNEEVRRLCNLRYTKVRVFQDN